MVFLLQTVALLAWTLFLGTTKLLPKEKYWTKPLEVIKSQEEITFEDTDYWRVIEKVIVHKFFNSSKKNLWKGHDFALLKLKEAFHAQDNNATLVPVVPVCLPVGNFSDLGKFQS